MQYRAGTHGPLFDGKPSFPVKTAVYLAILPCLRLYVSWIIILQPHHAQCAGPDADLQHELTFVIAAVRLKRGSLRQR